MIATLSIGCINNGVEISDAVTDIPQLQFLLKSIKPFQVA
jgi:hypothetical protein